MEDFRSHILIKSSFSYRGRKATSKYYTISNTLKKTLHARILVSFNRITQWNQYAYTHIGNTILHHPLKNRMISGNSMLNTGLKTSRPEFPASQRAAFSKWGTRGTPVLAQSWVKQRQRLKTGDYRPTGSRGLTTPAKGKEHHSFSAALVQGRGGYNNQPTNKQAGRGDARL